MKNRQQIITNLNNTTTKVKIIRLIMAVFVGLASPVRIYAAAENSPKQTAKFNPYAAEFNSARSALPAPVNPAYSVPAHPALFNPAAAYPVPAHPALFNPAAAYPVPTHPALFNPAAAYPVPTHPALFNPAAAYPVPTHPALFNPAAAYPVPTHPALFNPAAAYPVPTHPALFNPTAYPVPVHPAAFNPVAYPVPTHPTPFNPAYPIPTHPAKHTRVRTHAARYSVEELFRMLQVRPDLFGDGIPQEIKKSLTTNIETSPTGIQTPKEKHTSLYHDGYQGNRDKMQDDHSEASSQQFDFFTVCDGHGQEGFFVAKTCSDYLHTAIYRLIFNVKLQAAQTDTQEELNRSYVFQEAFRAMNENFLQLPQSNSSGTTVAIALVDKVTHAIYFAHVGDTRALLCSASGIHFATRDHTFTDPIEWNRIARAGGVITAQKPENPVLHIVTSIESAKQLNKKKLYVGKKDNLRDALNMPRSIGNQIFKQAGVSAEPTVSGPMPIPPTDGFLIIACDGVWDVMSNEQAWAIVKQALDAGKLEHEAAHDVVTQAFELGSTDNISVTVVYLSKYAMSRYSELH